MLNSLDESVVLYLTEKRRLPLRTDDLIFFFSDYGQTIVFVGGPGVQIVKIPLTPLI